jgi:hypothetical protein
VLDPNRILVGSQSNFGAPLASLGQEGSFLSIDPSGPDILSVPRDFAESGGQSSALAGAVQMFSANSPNWLNGVNNSSAFSYQYTGVSNPLGLSNNNAFGRLWPANAPFGDRPSARCSTKTRPSSLALACGCASPCGRRLVSASPSRAPHSSAAQKPSPSQPPDRCRNRTFVRYLCQEV